jgi:hypothetical protein
VIRALLDTAVLAIPNYGLSADDANQLIDRAFELSAAVASRLHLEILLSDGAEEALWACGCGPDYITNQDFLNLMGLGHVFSANDVLMAYQTLLGRLARSTAELHLEVRSFSSFESAPPLPAGLGPRELRRESKRGLVSSSLARQLGEERFHMPGWCGDPNAIVRVAAVASHVEAGSAWPAFMLPIDVQADVSLLSSVKSLISADIATLAWASAEDPEDLHFAIGLRALAALRDAGAANVGRVTSFGIGPSFMESLRANQCAGSGRMAAITLELCAQIVANRCNRFVGPMGRPRQTVRESDGALGWRVHLTDSHEALRLMYWDGPAGLEFANVGPKAELVIELGRPGEVAATDLSSLLD